MLGSPNLEDKTLDVTNTDQEGKLKKRSWNAGDTNRLRGCSSTLASTILSPHSKKRGLYLNLSGFKSTIQRRPASGRHRFPAGSFHPWDRMASGCPLFISWDKICWFLSFIIFIRLSLYDHLQHSYPVRSSYFLITGLDYSSHPHDSYINHNEIHQKWNTIMRSTSSNIHSTLNANTPHITVYIRHSSRRTLHFTPHTLHFTLYTPHSALYTPHSTFHTLLFTSHTSHFRLYTSQCAPHSPLYSLHLRLHTLHSTL